MNAANRLGDHDQIGPVADRLDHGVRVLGQAGRVVLTRKVRRHDVVTSCAQFGLDQVPVPADVAGAVDQDERGHRQPPRGTDPSDERYRWMDLPSRYYFDTQDVKRRTIVSAIYGSEPPQLRRCGVLATARMSA